ncbi:esterase-like activity of phytase family protein [Pelatocladus sp. BLCC-F211]|uniref:esterase-like activity of phytase family protein n=1 Tax=Pelatocladus sp. BLCC-F211 TaxID=3342752 RepID=UPI0035B81400
MTQDTIRFAQFNASLNRNTEGQLIEDLSTPDNSQAQAIAEIIQRTNPDVISIQEFDYYADDPTKAVDLFRKNYLEVSQNGADPVEYPYFYIAPSNTGISSGYDLNNDGKIVTTPGESGYGDDAFGFGNFPGQFGMLLLSKYPIDTDNVRTFQNFLWKDMPDSLLSTIALPDSDTPWYSQQEQEVVRLSSKSHWDVPIEVNGQIIHALVSHPTPPVFDGQEDRNGKRNHDEIRLWSDYITPGAGDYIYDDNGNYGGLTKQAAFVILGDQNADPNDGDSYNYAIRQLLENRYVNTGVTPNSQGGSEQALLDGGKNTTHISDPAYDTADFNDNNPGNIRADYVLPSKNLAIQDAKVFWPTTNDPLYRLVGDRQNANTTPSSDHSLVWADLTMTKASLVKYSSLPADTYADGPPSGQNDGNGKVISSNKRTGPFPGQPVQGFSGVQFADSDSYWFLSDNGFGGQTNSADYLLRIYKIDPDFKTVDSGSGNAQWTDYIQLSDPNNLISWQIVNENSPDRFLTGADFDPESIVLAEDGTIWIGEEFGPYLLHFDSNGVLIDAPVSTPNIYPVNTLNGQDPIVIGHRGGAPGIRPEHTIGDLGGNLVASNNLGAEFGADFLEPDLVVTKDGVLIVRHEPVLASVKTDANGNIIYDDNGKPVILEATTNVANFEKFSDRLTTKVLDGQSITGWFAEDFTLAEIKELRAVERIPNIRPESAKYDGYFQIPTLEEYINFIKEYEAETGIKLGIYPETKHPTYFAQEGKFLDGTPINYDTSQILIDTLIANNFVDPDRIFIQSFEVSNLVELENEIMPDAGIDIPLVQLIDGSGSPYDYIYQGIGKTYADLITPDGLTEIATYAEGIGPSKRLIVPAKTVDQNGDGQPDDINGDGQISDADRYLQEPTTLVYDAHQAGLLVHPYTFRSDAYYLSPDYKGNPQLEYEQFIRLGVDGYFTDFADDGVIARDKIIADYVASPQNPGVENNEAIANLSGSRGFEAISYSPDHKTLYPILEGYVAGDPTDALRVYKFDVATKTFSNDLVGYYQLSDPSHAIGDATPINDHEFLIIERDNLSGDDAKFKKVFKVDISQTNPQGYLYKEEVVDLLNIADPNDLNSDGSNVFTFPFQTIEDILVLDKNTILLANDNNYPFNATRNASQPDNNEFIVLELSNPLDLDPRLGTPKSTIYGTPEDDYFDDYLYDPNSDNAALYPDLFFGDNQYLFTGDGNDIVDVSIFGSGNKIDTGNDDDIVLAGTKNLINGGPGNDELYIGIGGGENIVTGGEGADQFWIVTDETDLPANPNTITDFNSTEKDVIGFANVSFTYDSLGSDWTTRQEGDNTIIGVYGQDVAVLLGIQATNLTQTNFAFA